MEDGSYRVVASFSGKMILCGNLEYTNQLIYWEINDNKIKKINFTIDDAEILSYQMLSDNELILHAFDNNSETKTFYCKIDWKISEDTQILYLPISKI